MKMKSQLKAAGKAASKLISERIAELGDWRGDTLTRMRALIREADPDVVEEWKWMGTPVWSHDGGICTGESYKSIVKLTFFKGASLKDTAKLFNSSLDGNARRAIDIHEGEEIDANPFKALIGAAVELSHFLRKEVHETQVSGNRKIPRLATLARDDIRFRGDAEFTDLGRRAEGGAPKRHLRLWFHPWARTW